MNPEMKYDEKTVMNALQSELSHTESLLYHCGYGVTFKVLDGYYPSIEIVSDDEDMPDIESRTRYWQDSHTYTFDLIVTFPVIKTDELAYPDSFGYIIDKWSELSRAVAEIKRTELDISNYADLD